VKRALREPALQALAGIAALIGFTWPLLVFERPVNVWLSFFAFWIVSIAALGAIAWAHGDAAADAEGAAPEESPDA